MQQFLETICIRDGSPQHVEWHQRRVDATMQHFYRGHHHSWTMAECIDVPLEFQSGVTRCRILYDAHHLSIHYFHYNPRIIKSLKLVEAPPGFDYRYKYADRGFLGELYELRGDCDDILITRDGWVTDTSVANIAFKKNDRWYTPSIPILAGTSWKRLVKERILVPTPINREDFLKFDGFRIYNAMNEFETAKELPVNCIIQNG